MSSEVLSSPAQWLCEEPALAVGVKRSFFTVISHNNNMSCVEHSTWTGNRNKTFSFYRVVMYCITGPAFMPLLSCPFDSNSSDLQEVAPHCELSQAFVLSLPLSSFLSLSISLDVTFTLNLYVACVYVWQKWSSIINVLPVYVWIGPSDLKLISVLS